MRNSEWVIGCAALIMACGPAVSSDAGGTSSGTGNDDGTDGRVDAGSRPPPPPSEFADAAPPQACEKMDIVFVVDNSGSMEAEQTNLALNYPMFAEVLDTFVTANGAELDYRAAVTSTGLTKTWTDTSRNVVHSQHGDEGAFLQRCDMTRNWVEKADPGAPATFACAARLGPNGPALEMPLEAIRLAFSDRVTDGTNAGFLRDDALLAIVILTDEDDCSRQDDNFLADGTDAPCLDPVNVPTVESYKLALDNVTGGPGRWAVAVIAGPGPGSCRSEFGDAEEAARLIEFANLAGDNGVVGSICQGDLAPALSDALATFDAACASFPPIE